MENQYAKKRYLIRLSLLSRVFTPAFQHFVTKEKNAAPIVGVVFVCVLVFQTGPGHTVSKVMTFQTEVDKAQWSQRIIQKGLLLWDWWLQSLFFNFFLLGWPDKPLQAWQTPVLLSLLLLYLKISFLSQCQICATVNEVAALLVCQHYWVAMTPSRCPLRVTASAWRMWTATCHCPQPATTTTNHTRWQHWAAAPAACLVEEASQSARGTASPSPPWSAPPNWPRMVGWQVYVWVLLVCVWCRCCYNAQTAPLWHCVDIYCSCSRDFEGQIKNHTGKLKKG